jgi:uncharacterized membrane protein
MADAGSLWLVWRTYRRFPQLEIRFLSVALLALCPASMMISGIHGNLDPLMIFLVLLSLFLLMRKRPIWLVALVFGLALNIKVVPLIFAPALIFNLPGLRERVRFCSIAVAVFFLGSLPLMLQDPVAILRSVFGHAGMYSQWGWTLLLVLVRHEPVFVRESGFHPPGLHGVIAVIAKCVLIVAIIAVSFWMNRKKTHGFIQYGVIAFLFMFVTPGFGAQYLSWLLPWVVAAGLRSVWVFYLTSGAYLLAAYGCIGGVFGCDSHLYLGLLCWVSIGFVLANYYLLTRRGANAHSYQLETSPLE